VQWVAGKTRLLNAELTVQMVIKMPPAAAVDRTLFKQHTHFVIVTGHFTVPLYRYNRIACLRVCTLFILQKIKLCLFILLQIVIFVYIVADCYVCLYCRLLCLFILLQIVIFIYIAADCYICLYCCRLSYICLYCCRLSYICLYCCRLLYLFILLQIKAYNNCKLATKYSVLN